EPTRRVAAQTLDASRRTDAVQAIPTHTLPDSHLTSTVATLTEHDPTACTAPPEPHHEARRGADLAGPQPGAGCQRRASDSREVREGCLAPDPFGRQGARDPLSAPLQGEGVPASLLRIPPACSEPVGDDVAEHHHRAHEGEEEQVGAE